MSERTGLLLQSAASAQLDIEPELRRGRIPTAKSTILAVLLVFCVRAAGGVGETQSELSTRLISIAFVNAKCAAADRLICLHRTPARLFGVNQLDVDGRHAA
jgi:hypothetical protein